MSAGVPSDAVNRAVIDAMTRRAEALQGEARQWLLRRIDERRAATSAAAPTATPARPATLPALSALVALVDDLGRTPPSRPAEPPSAPLKTVAAFQPTWSRLRAERRLRQAMAQVPSMAGPLNSSHLVNQALQAMHRLSPAYLDGFMAHVDTLLWLEQARGAALASEPAPRERARRKS